MRTTIQTLALGVVFGLAGCTTPQGEYSDLSRRHQDHLSNWQERMETPREARVRITDMPNVGERIELERHRWLRDKNVTLSIGKGETGITAHTLAQMLNDQGISVMSSLPLEGYKYTGFGVRNVDGITALRMLFGPMGLDYDVSDDGNYVVITPNRSKTFYVKLGERVTEYQSGTMTGNIGDGGSGGGGGGGGAEGESIGVTTGLDTGTGRITIAGDFWTNITTELTSLMTQCVPTAVSPSSIPTMANLPGLAAIQGMPGSGQGGIGGMGGVGGIGGMGVMQQSSPVAAQAEERSLCTEQQIGRASVNPSTGSINVQAPHWVLADVDKYISNIQDDNAVTLIYEGMLIAITTTRERQEGIDLQAFASFASGQLGMVVSNNALGGVTVAPGSPPVPGADAVAGTLIGVQKLAGNPAQAFLAYLEANSDFSIMQRPRVAVTNGVPGEFGQYDTLFYNRIDQQATGGGIEGGAAVGTTNELIPFKIGNLLRIVPYFDAASGFVRSPITFTQSVQTGSFETVQYITGSDGAIQAIPSEIPLIRDSNYSGEVLMRDGDMMIIGGQISEQTTSAGSGIPGYNARRNPFSGLMGQKRHSDDRSTYYLALTLRINKP